MGDASPLNSLSSLFRAIQEDQSDAEGGTPRVIGNLSPPSVAQGEVDLAIQQPEDYQGPAVQWAPAPIAAAQEQQAAQIQPAQQQQILPPVQQQQVPPVQQQQIPPPAEQVADAAPPNPDAEIKCFKCGKVGHRKQFCPNRKQKPIGDKPSGVQKQRGDRGGADSYAVGKTLGAAVAAFFNTQQGGSNRRNK